MPVLFTLAAKRTNFCAKVTHVNEAGHKNVRRYIGVSVLEMALNRVNMSVLLFGRSTASDSEKARDHEDFPETAYEVSDQLPQIDPSFSNMRPVLTGHGSLRHSEVRPFLL